MQLLVFRSLWGMTGSIEEQIERIATAGYDGVEGFVGASTLSTKDFTALVLRHGLRLIMAGAVSTKDEIEPTLKQLAEYEPLKIGLHSGRDSMTRDEGCALFETALRIEAQIGIPVGHETHRGRILYSPWDALFYLRQFDSLKIVADYSHWVNVCERLPDDQAEVLDLANRRTLHIHARIGYEEGPQVPDPSAPEYAPQRAWHERQWQQIKQQRKASGDEILTLTPEYGPPPYLHTLPHTNVPVADNWQVCLWGMKAARYLLL
jgi:sugar phosphate isomerase/epimerase